MTPDLLVFSPVLSRKHGAHFAARLEEVDVDLVPWLEEYSDEELEELEERIARWREDPSVQLGGEHPAPLIQLLLRRQILLRVAGGEEQ